MSTRREQLEDAVLGHAERLIYLLIALVLVGGAVVLLGTVVARLISDLDQGVDRAIEEALSTLLIAFIFVELLGAVRSTLREGRLIAEPFLLVGIIALIKEVVLVTGTDDALKPGTDTFNDAMVEVGVFAVLVLVLVVATWLLRLKEREPSETQDSE